MMKKLLLTLALWLAPFAAMAQCNGVFSPNTVCGTVAGGIPGQVPATSLAGGPGGSPGQIQYNNSGTLGGFTQSGDCTTNTSTGVTTCLKTNGVAFTPVATALAAGVPTNTRSAYTGAAAMATTDCGKTVALGGSAFYTFTVNAASTYAGTCMVIITNEDSLCPSGGASTCRGKTLAINGYANFILWPGQTFVLGNQNNTWQYDQPGLWQLQNLETWYVCHASGVQTYFAGGTSIGGTTPSDTNDGLSVNAPFATQQGAMTNLRDQIAFNSFGPTIQNCNETFTENNAQAFGALQGVHVFFVQGNPTTPANVTWQCSGTGNACETARDWGGIILSGFKFVGTGTGNIGVQASQWGVVDLRNVEFGSMPAGTHIGVGAGGGVNYSSGTYTISGSAGTHIQLIGDGHAVIDGIAISMPNALAFTQFVQMIGSPYLEMSGTTFTGAGSGGGSTGVRYIVDNAASLTQATVTFPGTSPGRITGAGAAWTAFTPNFTCGTATISNNGSQFNVIGNANGKTTWVGIDFTITAIGTCSTQLTFTLPNTPAISAAVTGREMAATNLGFSCGTTGASATMTCSLSNAAVLAVNDRITAGGTYQNQ